MIWLKENWKGLALVLLLPVGFIIGRFTATPQVRIEEHLKVVEVIKEVVVEKEKMVVHYLKDTATKEKYHRETTETKTPDGTYVKKETEDRNVDTVVKEQSQTIKVVEVEKQVVVEREKIVDRKIEPVLSNWRVSAMAGIQPSFDPIGWGKAVGGGSVERRLVGPIWVGLWGLSSPAVGAKVSVEF